MKYKLLLAFLLTLALALPALAQSNDKDNNDIKQDTKDAAHSTAQATRKTGHKIKRGTKRAAHKTARATRRGADKVEDKTTDRDRPNDSSPR